MHSLEYLKRLQIFEPFHAKITYPVFPLAGELLFDEKIRQSDALFWFGLRAVGILYSRAVIQ
jgi:hypothetical protein